MPGDEVVVVEGMDERAVGAFVGAVLERLPRDVDTARESASRRARACAAASRRRRLDRDDRARHAGLTRRVRNALARVAGADRPHAAPAFGLRQHQYGIGRAAQLVGVDRLQGFELQPDVGMAGPSSRRTSGVRTMVPLIRSRAARISASSIGRTASSGISSVLST